MIINANITNEALTISVPIKDMPLKAVSKSHTEIKHAK
ncbi:hypothetical protein AO375_1898 [Moraxella catarrhalis]|nr:hypothetical protein AO375_1898 [Moraxella catarrhalis]